MEIKYIHTESSDLYINPEWKNILNTLSRSGDFEIHNLTDEETDYFQDWVLSSLTSSISKIQSRKIFWITQDQHILIFYGCVPLSYELNSYGNTRLLKIFFEHMEITDFHKIPVELYEYEHSKWK